MRHLLLIVFSALGIAAFAQSGSPPYVPPYDSVMYANPGIDKLCTIERERARADMESSKSYFIDNAIYKPRYARYMPQLCQPYHLTYWWLPEAQLGYEGFNPLRCYMAATDSMVKQRYGTYFKSMLIARADSFFIAGLPADTIDEQYCRPTASLATDSIYQGPDGEQFFITIDSALYKQYRALSHNPMPPCMFVNIFIDTTGKATAYKMTRLFDYDRVYYADTLTQSPTYNGCGNSFWQLALARLKHYPQWKPAYIGNRPVKTWHRVKVLFKL